ncbi:DUF7544 domain-containing protein [Tunturiibacter gelidiferens]
MRILSAAEAITPAIERTKSMFRPFSLRSFVKLGLVALLAEMGAQFIFPPTGHFASHSNSRSGAVSWSINQHAVVALAVVSVLFLLIGVCMLYFGSRMQFVLMDLVAYRTTVVGPSWRRHGPKTWPWIGLKVATFLLAFLVIGAVAAWPLLHLIRSIPSKTGQPPDAAFFGNFLFLFAMIAGMVVVLMLCLWFLRDMVLPFLVFEDATMRQGFTSAVDLIRREPGGVLLYFLMKFVLTLVAGIAAELCIVATVLVAGIPIGLIGGGLWLLLRHAGPFGIVFLYTSFGLLTVIFFACLMLAIVCIAGVILVFYQAYALYFVGGRVSALGDLLEPQPPPFPEAATQQFSPI